jgi:hypothetical protein
MKFRHFAPTASMQQALLRGIGWKVRRHIRGAWRRYEQTSYPLSGDRSYWHQPEKITRLSRNSD